MVWNETKKAFIYEVAFILECRKINYHSSAPNCFVSCEFMSEQQDTSSEKCKLQDMIKENFYMRMQLKGQFPK